MNLELASGSIGRFSVTPLREKALFALVFLLLIGVLGGCATPDIKDLSGTEILQPDEEDNIGGTFLESGDIRTIATRMAAELLSTPEISSGDGVVRIAVAPIRNSTRFIVDKDIFMKRLRIELNRVGGGQVRFFSQNVGQTTRRQILRERTEELWDQTILEVANYIVASTPISQASEPPTIAVIPVRNTNIAGLNADSFTALMRAKIAELGHGQLIFLARDKNGKVIEEILDEQDIKNLGLVKARRLNELYGVDYFLGGEFIAKDLRVQKPTVSVEQKIGTSEDDPRFLESSVQGAIKDPNTTTYLNVMLIDASTGTVPVEKMVKVEPKMKTGLGRSDYLLTGELSALSKATGGAVRSDYIILSFQLVDPESNEVLWEDAYETKKKARVGTVYR
ncbi:MAG: hypothetical protein JRJ47_09900 [Deltaproteobacteria bacterium]|nr:hypothetical protein [Deltaproteobacteria bacterium]